MHIHIYSYVTKYMHTYSTNHPQLKQPMHVTCVLHMCDMHTAKTKAHVA